MVGKTLLIFGYGYVARYLCDYMQDMPWDIYVTSRNRDMHDQKVSRNARVIDYHSTQVLDLMQNASAVLSTVPPVAEIQDPVLDIYEDAMKNSPASWIGYLSATSVYGHHDGAWVDEELPCVPHTPKAMLRLQSEEQWHALYHQHGKPVHIFRLAGIYGPFQNVLVQLKNGKRDTIVKSGHYFSRIHVADICKGLVASMEQPHPWAIYNMADDESAPLHVVQQYGAQLLELPQLTETPYDQANLIPGMREFFENNKRVCAQKIQKDLNVSWTYPTYREGLMHERCAVNL